MNEDLKGLLLEVAASLIVAAITAAVAMAFTKKYFPMLGFANEMKKHGFQSVSLKRLNNRELKAVIEALPEEDRKILLLHIQGYTQEEIAKKLGYKTHSAVGKKLKKIKAQLKNTV